MLDLLVWLKPRGLNRVFDAITPKDIKDYYKFLEESVAARRKVEEASQQIGQDGKAERQDVFHFLFQAKNPNTGEPAYSEQELLAEAKLLTIAGSDKTSITLCGFFFYISRNQRPYNKLVKEIRNTFASTAEIVSGARLSSCHYLCACLDEAMRLTPAVPSELSRNILSGGQTIDGEFYPKGTAHDSASHGSLMILPSLLLDLS